MARYRKKPVVVEAEVYRPGLEDGYKVYEQDYPEEGYYFVEKGEFDPEIHVKLGPAIKTLEGWLEVNEEPADIIVTGVKGERYPVKPDIFEATYEPAGTREGLLNNLEGGRAEAAAPGPWTLDTDYFKTCPQHGAKIDTTSDNGRDWTRFHCGCRRQKYVPRTCPWCGAEREQEPWYKFVTYRCSTWITEGGVVHRSESCLRSQIKALLLDEIERLRQQNAALRSALSELVTLKDEVKPRDPTDYERRKPAAWQAAREALERERQTGMWLSTDDCNILMHGLRPPEELLYTGNGQTIPPSEDTPEMRATREHYRRLMERIIDVGAGLAGGANDA